jgi:hypothetical protein
VAEEAALAAASGIEVLRAELAEERERSRLAIAELEAELEAARRRADALRNAAAAEAAARAALAIDDDGDEDATQPLAADAIAVDEDDHATPPVAAGSTSAQPVALSSRRGRVVRPQSAPASAHATAARGPGPWMAVGALALFAFALLGLLLGFLP